jgi:hypothetical protein
VRPRLAQGVVASFGASALVLGLATLAHTGCSGLEATLVASGDDGAASCALPRPPEGVYAYSTEQNLPAQENLTVNGTLIKLDVGPSFSGSVRYDGAGYVFRSVLGDHHSTALHLSRGPTALDLRQFEETVYGNVASVACVPPVAWIPCALSTAVLPMACTGENSLVDGGFNLVGAHTLASQNEAVVVAGKSVPALHFIDHRSIQGTSKGSQDLDWWFRTTDGLLLRNIVSTRVSSPSAQGPVTYAVNLDYTLLSEAPSPLPADTSGGL